MSEVHSSKGEVVLPRIGEVVESASERFVAQCYQLYQSPSLGAFVRTDAAPRAGGEFEPSSIYAVVCGVSTQALDPGRPVVARGEEEATEEDVYRSNPQLMRLLCTRFEALIVGTATVEPSTSTCLPCRRGSTLSSISAPAMRWRVSLAPWTSCIFW